MGKTLLAVVSKWWHRQMRLPNFMQLFEGWGIRVHTLLCRIADQLGAIVQAQFAHQPVAVGLYCSGAEAELG